MTKLLVIDDEEGIVEEIRAYFSEEGFDVRTATTGARGLRLVREFLPDLVLIDLKLPDIPGLRVLESAREIHPAAKFIVNTGYVDQKLVDEAHTLGCDSFLHKPFDLTRLSEEIERLKKSGAS